MKKLCSLAILLMLVIGSLSACAPTTPVEEINEVTYDVVVIGGGAAGLAAAIEASKAGANVVLLEKLPMLGGSTLLSAGIIYGTGFTIQKEAGIEDSVDALVAYWMERAENKANEEYLRFAAERSGETIDWLASIGVVFGEPYPTGSSPVARAVTAEGGGNGLIEPLEAEALAQGVEILLQTTAESLVSNTVLSGNLLLMRERRPMQEHVREAIFQEVEREPLVRTLGMRLMELEDGFSAVEITYEPARMDNLFGRMHGGAIFALIDEAFETVCQTDGTMTVALNVNVSYVASPEPGSRLRAEARQVSRTKKTATYDIRVSDDGGQLIATCQALAYRTGKPLPFLP